MVKNYEWLFVTVFLTLLSIDALFAYRNNFQVSVPGITFTLPIFYLIKLFVKSS